MSNEQIKTYIKEARTFYLENQKDVPPEDMEERLKLLITQDMVKNFKLKSKHLAPMYYEEFTNPRSLYEVQQKVSVNSEAYDDFVRLPPCLLSSSYGHSSYKQCFPTPDECNECWKYSCSRCAKGSNSMYTICDNQNCLNYMGKYMPSLTKDMTEHNKKDIYLVDSRVRLKDDEVEEYTSGLEDNYRLVRIR